MPSYRELLAAEMSADLAREIDIFETQIELRKKGKIEEKLFAETRLRRGVYGQRYDNGQRHDGHAMRDIRYPSGDLTKGPMTLWDAPGMQRIKLPFGAVTARQLEVMAECAEEYSDGILHVTTRQDIQLHFVHIDDTPDLMRRLAAVGVTTREACGNSVRNITACPYAGVCNDESFDVAPYAHAATYFLMGHDDTQDFGRKFKIAFSGCADHACGLVSFHDLGCVAKVQIGPDGERRRGFQVVVGGGLGSVPHAAKVLADFVPEDELLPTMQAVARLFSRMGERENRARARLKFVIKKVGIDEFSRLVREEREKLRDDPRWRQLDRLAPEKPAFPPAPLKDASTGAFAAWRRSNVRPQAQTGYVVATVTLPLGDLTSDQARSLASLSRRFTGDTMRTTVEQNLVFRWLPEASLPALYSELAAIGLAEGGASTITDITSCPGTDTCKLGISSSRGLAGELRKRLTVLADELDPAARALHIKTSGCFNSCGQHHVADIGFLGVSRNVGGRRVPHFQVVVGGEWEHNAGSFGLAIGAIPSKRVPDMVLRLSQRFVAERREGERFSAFIQRIGKKEVRAMVDSLAEVPAHEADPSFYSDWGDPREYSIGDMGVGECAGEVVPYAIMTLSSAEREVFESQLLLEQGDARGAASRALRAMITGARALVRERVPDIGDDPEEIVAKFNAALVEPKIFFDPFAGAKFAHYLFKAHREGVGDATAEHAHQRIEEAQLFVDAAYQCYDRMVAAPTKAL
ncbi:MAG: nitrite/sulfite reductase [Polyangiaceae bacterium]